MSEKKWSKKGFEVHTSKDGTEGSWYRYRGAGRNQRPMYAENELRTAKADFKKAQREHKFTQLLKLKMDYEIIEVNQTEETESERMEKTLKHLRELFKNDTAVNCYECSSMDMSTLQLSKSYIKVEIKTDNLACGPQPQRKHHPQGPLGKAEYEAAAAVWVAKARPLHEIQANMVRSRLMDAGLKYQTARYNGFESFLIL